MTWAGDKVLIGIGTICEGYWLVGTLRNGFFRGDRLYGHRKISREKQPRLYWVNVFLMAVIFVVGLLLLFVWR
jgi:hypothetical protein